MANDYNKREQTRWTRTEVAALLGVTEPRVSQIATAMRMSTSRNKRGEIGYTIYQVSKMQKRDTKPGPKPKRGKQA